MARSLFRPLHVPQVPHAQEKEALLRLHEGEASAASPALPALPTSRQQPRLPFHPRLLARLSLCLALAHTYKFSVQLLESRSAFCVLAAQPDAHET